MSLELPHDELLRLNRAYKYCYSQLEPMRKTRKHFVNAYIGKGYTLNLLAQAVNILGRYLMGGDINILATSRVPEETYTAYKLGAATTLDAKRIGLSDILVDAAIDAFFSEGWAMVGKFGDPSDWDRDSGSVRASVRLIDFDDVCFDMNALRWTDVQFVGNRFFAALDDVKKTDHYRRSAVRKLEPLQRYFDTTEGMERTSTLTRKDSRQPEVYREMVALRNVWIPHRGVLLTMADDEEPNVLYTMRWEGPERGPYHRLGFFPISGQLLHLPFASLIGEMSISINSIFSKAIHDEENAKTVYSALMENEEFARVIINAEHGQVVTKPGNSPIEQHTLMGASGQAVGLVAMLRDFLSYAAGNMDSVGGLSAQADTVGQEQLISQAASGMVSQMQRQCTRFAQQIVEDLAWYRWKSRETVKVQQRIGQRDYWVDFGPKQKKGREFFDQIIEIQPYSHTHRTPAQRLAQFLECVQLAAQLPIPNKAVNGEYIMETVARLRDLPEAQGIYKTVYPSEGPGEEFSKEGPSKPAMTRREYVRTNRPGRSRRGMDFALAQTGLGGGIQDSEAQAAMRSGA